MSESNKSSKNPKNAGAKRKYTIEQLLSIVDAFLINKYNGEISASLVAKYAREELNYTKIKYYHFTQRPEILQKIEEIQKERKLKYVSYELESFQNMNITAFVDRYFGNRLRLEQKLQDIQEGELSMYNRMVSLASDNRKLTIKLKETECTTNELETEKKEFAIKSNELKSKVIMLQKLINVDNHIKMLEFVWENAGIEPNDLYQQYLMILSRCNIISQKDFEEIRNNRPANGKEKEKETKSDNIINIFKEATTKQFNMNNTKDKEDVILSDNGDSLDEISTDELDELLSSDDDKDDLE